MQPVTYDIKTICQLTSLGQTQVYEEIKAGNLKAKKCGRRTLVTAESLAEWLEGLKNYSQHREE